MLQKLGYSDVATGDFQNLPRISQPSIAVVEYQYLAYERIVNIIESLVKRNVFIILHTPVKEELMFSAVCSLYAYFVTPFRGLFNLDSLKQTLGSRTNRKHWFPH
ncbi:hypothetical protein JCM19233_6890 [Vibrio astriarenae]|nr:hypothetical protein JCM19233_6890 [Vibrio sp. C7]